MTAPLILGTNSIKDEGYVVDNSLRFDEASTDYLNKTFSTPTNNKIWTWSAWVKRSKIQDGDYPNLFCANSLRDCIRFLNGDGIQIFFNEAGSGNLETSAKFRDMSAFYNIVVGVDTTQSTSSNRVKLYVNGEQITDFATENYPTQNYTCFINSAIEHRIGRDFLYTEYFNGYMAEVVFVDGQQLDATSFGEFDEDSNIWKPKDVSELTFGNNGFYLDFEDSSALGNDVSGNNNDFTVNNLTSIDQTTDTCTINFATLNGAFNLSGTLSEGNLKYATSNGYGSQGNTATSTIGVSSGKWYAEFKCGGTTGSFPNGMVGVYYNPEKFQNGTTNPAQSNDEGFGYAENGNIYNNSSTSTGTTYTSGDIISVALDLDGNKVYWYKNGTVVDSNGTAIDSGETYFFFIADTSGSGGTTFESNFGNPPFSISSGNSDGNGYGNFEYSVPSGYYALNSKNLAEFG